MSTDQIFYVVDSSHKSVVYTGTWDLQTGHDFYGGDMETHSSNEASGASVTCTFDGISIAFIGISELQKSLLVSIDNAPQFTQTLGSLPASDPDSYYQGHQWYQTPTLPQGVHTIELTLDSPLDLGLDYMVVVPGPDTSLTGKNVMVDDSFSSIEYIGSWERIAGADFVPPLTGFRMPFQNSTHRTSTVGDILKFSYTGADLRIYGLSMGQFNMTVTYDNGPPEPQTVVPRVADAGIPTHYILFDSGPRPAGLHNIALKITQCSSDAAAILDYIVYDPAFSTLNTLNVSTSQQSSSSTVSIVETGKARSASNLAAKKTLIGAIVGGVVGACLILAVLVCILLRKRKRHHSYRAPVTQRETFDPKTIVLLEHAGSAPGSVTDVSGSRRKGMAASYKHRRGFSDDDTPEPPASTSQFSLQPMPTMQTMQTASLIAEITRRAIEISELQKVLQDSQARENTNDLKRQVQMLTEENERLAAMTMSPPSYDASPSGYLQLGTESSISESVISAPTLPLS
ncbi:hypothetical protein C8J56DRAFT_106704 [Mycena floridula]|nr:hypothetical protein C8J56DRAFT_106704 [Mycena floridula]